MRCACIDIGSTTTRLLVASWDGALRTVDTARAYTPDDPELLAQVVADQLARAARLGAPVRVVGTAFLRRRPDLVAALPADVEVLSGEDEGRLAFLGATHGRSGTCAVVDVGGGSTEVVVGEAGGTEVAYVASFAVGSGVLVDRCAPLDPPTDACLARLADAAADALAACDAPPAATALAVGGSATAVAHGLCHLGRPQVDRGDAPLTATSLRAALEALREAPAAAVARRTGLHPRRVRLLTGGLSLLAAAAATLDRPLHLAQGGLREGVVLEHLRLL